MESLNSFWRTLTRERNVKPFERLERIFESLSITEKGIFLVFAVIFAGAVLSLASKTSYQFGSDIPRAGGELIEGIIGTPRFINPLLAASDADRDVTTLVYSGLLKATPDGEFVPDLAKEFTISPDGLTYTFTLRDDAVFHDGKPLTTADIEFTVDKAKDTSLKSPKRVNWEGVVMTVTDEKTISFSIRQPYKPFINSLTLGILPKHIWKDLSSDQFPFSSFNIQPIGSGPYKMVSVKRSGDGIPTQISLRANNEYALGKPYITNIYLNFFATERALVSAFSNGEIESASNLTPSSAKSLEKNTNILSAPLTRVFGIFFNQNENELLAHKEVRKALAASINKDDIIESVLLGYGSRTDGPLPSTAQSALIPSDFSSTTISEASKILEKAKWEKNGETGFFEKTTRTTNTTLAISLSTANIPELVESAKRIEENWTELGVQVDVRVFEPSDLNQGVIRPRQYEALLFGLVTGKNSDLYPFWHSSQRNDPGLNVALYTNARADRFLERMRTATSSELIANLYADFKKEIDTDSPAVFLWSPDFIYATPNKLQGVELGEITTPSDRFLGVEKWYVKTDHVWNVFVKDKTEIIKN
jgi:peptide/nickel transport system substrate-binding protein